VAAVAVSLSVDNEAAKSYQATLFWVFPFEVQRDRSYRVTDVDELIFVVIALVLGLHATRSVYHARENNRDQNYSSPAYPFDNEACLHGGSPVGLKDAAPEKYGFASRGYNSQRVNWESISWSTAKPLM
jgi:hypothetical protein